MDILVLKLTNVDVDTENQTGATFKVTVFPEKPYQPLSFKFPTGTFDSGAKERSFRPQWYQKHPWLHYDMALDKAFCHTCIKAIKLGTISATKYEEAFTKTGFENWKKELEKHNDSNLNKKTSEDLMKTQMMLVSS